MKNYKRVLFLVFFLFTSLLYAQQKITILTSNTILADVVSNLVDDDDFVVDCLLEPGIDPHSYEPVTGDVKKIFSSDVLIVNGLHLEGWLGKMLNEPKKCPVIVATQNINPIQNSNTFESPDPHVWMDPLLMKEMVKHISSSLKSCYPEKQKVISLLETQYQNKLDQTHDYILLKSSKIPQQKRILITTHDAFRYYGNRYGFEVLSAMGISTDAEVMIEDMVKLSKTVKEKQIAAVFVESTLNPKFFDQFAKDHKILLGKQLYADALGPMDSNADTYLKMLVSNTDNIVESLSKTIPEQKHLVSEIPYQLIFVLVFLFGFIFWVVTRKIHKKGNHSGNWGKYTILIDDVSCSYHSKPVLSHINLELESGKLYGLLGPNGAGKSTFFKSILGLVKPDSGKILINNLNIEQVRDKIAYIPQKEEIDWSFPATVLDIVLTGRIPHKKVFQLFNEKDKNKAYEALQKVDMLPFKDRQIGGLSGGQQQRVFIARALCEEAEILMFDEPFVGVDAKSEEKIVSLIKSLVKEKKTVLIIHHDLGKVKDYFDSVIMINRRLVAFGPTSEVFNDKNISEAYGGRPSILDEADKLLKG
ncbi:MAG: zinc ABC transporter substrate-binding protein [Cytophagales bacterium]